MFYFTVDNEYNLIISDKKEDGYIQVFEEKDLPKIQKIIKEAETLWNNLTKEYLKKEKGDWGTCVLGAGIQIPYIPKETKKLKKLTHLQIINQPNCCQGSVNWEGERLKAVLNFLKNNGIENAKYNAGYMD